MERKHLICFQSDSAVIFSVVVWPELQSAILSGVYFWNIAAKLWSWRASVHLLLYIYSVRLLLSELPPVEVCNASVQFQMKIWKINRCRSRSPKCANFGHFTLFCIGWLTNAQRFITPVNNRNFDCKNMNIYFKYESCKKLFIFILTVTSVWKLNMECSVKLEIELKLKN